MLNLKNDNEKYLFQEIMERVEKTYDKNEHMITQWRGEHGYHSMLSNCTVHPTRDTLAYAYELMLRGEKEDFCRVEDILNRVIPLQDTDPSHNTYGIWSYYAEEPLEKMAPPDWNWADFCGEELLKITLSPNSSHLSENSSEMMRKSIIHAANSIMRRDMGPHYTNISILGTYVTIVAGEYFGEQYLVDYAKKRLKTLHDFNMGHGAFQEYNSPSYTWVVINCLASMLDYIKDEESRSLAEDLNDLAWRCLADHYHYKTKQWAGPHSRFYAMLEDDVLLMRIQRALNYQINLVPLDKPDLADELPMEFFSTDSHCPEIYKYKFTELNKETFGNAVFAYGETPEDTEIAISYLSAPYTLGTFYKSIFWNQKRNHLAYFGIEDAPVYCGLKCLHDGYDYSSGVIVTAQDKNRTVSVIGFATDGGDTHCGLDLIKNASIKASDLRIRFEFGGAVENLSIYRQEGNVFLAESSEISVRITFPYIKFGDFDVFCEIVDEEGHISETGDHKNVGHVKCVDAVLYHGSETILNFKEFEQCCCAATFEIAQKGLLSEEKPLAEVKDNVLIIKQNNIQAEGLKLASTLSDFRRYSKAYVNGKEYLETMVD